MKRIITIVLAAATVAIAFGATGTAGSVQPAAAASRQVWAYYFGWYTGDSWGNGALTDHPAQLYNSGDAGVIGRQIQQAKSAGIDAFIMSWFGPKNGNLTMGNFNLLLNVAAANGFHAAASVDMQEGGYNATTGEVLDSLHTLIGDKVNSPGYLRYNGKPVIYFWNENRFSAADWATMRSQVDPGHKTIWVMEGTNTSLLKTFDGLYLFNIAWSTNFAGTAGGWMSKTFGAGGSFYSATVMPGWDESRLGGRTNPTSPQARGTDNQFLIASWNGAISSGAPVIMIVSWNEYFENSYIEPSQKLGTTALDTLRPLTARWKGGSNAPAPIPGGGNASGNPSGGAVANPNATATPLPATGDWQGKSITPRVDLLFVRGGPGPDFPSVGMAKRGEVYRITGKPNATWYQIDYNGKTGFVYIGSVQFAN